MTSSESCVLRHVGQTNQSKTRGFTDHSCGALQRGEARPRVLYPLPGPLAATDRQGASQRLASAH